MTIVSGGFQLPPVLLEEPDAMASDDLSTEILPAPPSLSSLPPTNFKKDSHQKKFVGLPQYLPSCDPGSTYTGGSGVMSGLEAESRRRKRPRLDKRAQRASARTMAANHQNHDSHLEAQSAQTRRELHPPENPLGEGMSQLNDTVDGPMMDPQSSDPSLSASRISARPLRRKGRAEEGSTRQSHSETIESSSLTPVQNPATSIAQANHDHCSACRSVGSLLYCDSCPRAYHLWCLNPPLDHNDIPGPGVPWDCPACVLGKNPKPAIRKRFMSELIFVAQNALPSEYSLPEDIRCYFKNVGTGPRGTYTDGVSSKPRLNRLGFPEDRDPYRLRDRNGCPVLCFRCGKTALPTTQTSSNTERPRRLAKNDPDGSGSDGVSWKSMLSCDFCSSSWHLDCITPPLTSMPSLLKKWMCPNHAEQTISNRRQPKVGLHQKEIRKIGSRNTGLIEIIPSNDVHSRNTVAVDEVLINSRVYRVPERVIILDFWGSVRNKIGEQRSGDLGGITSSPLSSLTSLDDIDDSLDPQDGEEGEALNAAQVLCALPTLPDGYWAEIPRKSGKRGSPSSQPSVKMERTTPELFRSAIPSSPLSVLSELTPEPDAEESKSTPRPGPNAKLKIRIPLPLNIAVASASRAAKQPATPPRRSLRNPSSSHRSTKSTSLDTTSAP